jgi:REP element-mobilizing transposase RayT
MGNNFHAPLEPGHFYHVYNRGNNSENIFVEDKNYPFFLDKWGLYLDDYLDVLAYCLMPGHFHFLVQIKDKKELKEVAGKDLTGFKNLSGLLSKQFSKLFNSYAKSFNKVYDRNGNLFQRPFKRIEVDSRDYLIKLIHYIHHNPIHHEFTNNYDDWPYSSYKACLSNHSTKIKRKKVLDYFCGKNKFISFHEKMKDYKNIDHLLIE